MSCPYFWYHSSAVTASHPMSAICLRKNGVPHISIQLSTLHSSTGKGWAILLYTLYKNSSNWFSVLASAFAHSAGEASLVGDGDRWWRMAYFSHSARTAHGTPPKVL